MPFEYLTTPTPEPDILSTFHPAVRQWWTSRFPTMSLPQRLAIPAIHHRKNTLLCAPTGSGKTLAAFIAILSDLFTRATTHSLPTTIDTLYISPLRALATDITKNLLVPLQEIFASPAVTPPQIENRKWGGAKIENPVSVALRTGDSTPHQRSQLAKHPPHILITTPETLALCLVNPTMRHHLRATQRIIIDELHSLAPNKRGTDLILSLERLAHFITSSGNPDPQRIGLSATIAPLDRIASFLVGPPTATPPRSCSIADAAFDRPLDLQIASIFGKTPFATTANINRHIYDLLEKTIRQHRTTLIFTNLRAATERVTFHLRKRFAANGSCPDSADPKGGGIIAPEQIQAHHSSLDRDVRLDIESRLKSGSLRCVVCSTSLELGIDIGSIDRVILLNNPKGVARALQRVGRSGHSLGATASGLFIPTLPADLLESLITADAMRKRHLEPIPIPQNPLDVLAQQLLAMTIESQPQGISIDDAYSLIRRTLPYANLPREQFDSLLHYLAAPELLPDPPSHIKLLIDSTHRLHPRQKSLAALYSQNVGTITQESQVKVRLSPPSDSPNEKSPIIGHIEEAFAQLLKPNDRFLLGGRCVRVVAAKSMSLYVAESTGQSPTIPRWFSGSISLEPGLTAAMRDLRAQVRAIAPAGPAAIARFLTRRFTLPDEPAHIAAQYLHAQHRYAEIPTDTTGLLIERVPDDDSTVLIFHTLLGRAANDALARTLAYRIHQRFGEKNGNAGGATVVVDDYAFGIWLQKSAAARRADKTLIRSLLSPQNFSHDLTTALESSELFRTQFHHTALRAHTLLRNKFGRRRFIGQLHSYSQKLYESLRANPQHPLITETHRTLTQDLLNAPLAELFLQQLPQRPVRLLDLPTPSPFAFGLFTSSKRDSLQLADSADFLLHMYQKIQARLNSQQTAIPQPAQSELFS